MTSYAAAPIHGTLDDRFYQKVDAANFPDHLLRYRNDRAAASIGLDGLDDAAWISHFGKFQSLPENFEQPLALAITGISLASIILKSAMDADSCLRRCVIKMGAFWILVPRGLGPRPIRGTADGRLTLKGAVREILATEMLQALGVNTSKTFSVIETGEALQRHDEPSPTRAAVLVRLSSYPHWQLSAVAFHGRPGRDRNADPACRAPLFFCNA